MPRPSQDGLEWEQTLFHLVPQWTRDPDAAAIERICRQRINISPEGPCSVVFHASGLFNKIYLVKYDGGKVIMRVSLPVYPGHKTRAEVATLHWLRENTAIPVPKVFGFDDSNENEIGFEWMMIELMEGMPARDRWWSMSMEDKVRLTEQIAAYQIELCGINKEGDVFKNIKTLDLQRDQGNNTIGNTAHIVPGPFVWSEFFMGDRLFYPVPRGPFQSSRDWLISLLDIIILDRTDILANSDDEDDKEDAEEVLMVARKLLSLVPKILPAVTDETRPERTALYHHDLHLGNILVNEQGQIMAILDWECVSTLPHWMFTKPPKFLDEPQREEEPQEDAYAPARQATGNAESRTHGDVSNSGTPGRGNKDELFYIHKMEYAATQLRKVYEAKLREHWPQPWPPEDSQLKLELFDAISQCDSIWVKQAHKWIQNINML